MITRFMGSRSHVKSLNVPYVCPSCQHEHFEVLEVSPGITVQPQLKCPKCPGQMVVDDLIDTYNHVLGRL
jgi:DNA polymerase III alpha subunit (gram-positive type)